MLLYKQPYHPILLNITECKQVNKTGQHYIKTQTFLSILHLFTLENRCTILSLAALERTDQNPDHQTARMTTIQEQNRLKKKRDITSNREKVVRQNLENITEISSNNLGSRIQNTTSTKNNMYKPASLLINWSISSFWEGPLKEEVV